MTHWKCETIGHFTAFPKVISVLWAVKHLLGELIIIFHLLVDFELDPSLH
jgi:hypothetical protein